MTAIPCFPMLWHIVAASNGSLSIAILRLPRIRNHCFRGCPLSMVSPSLETSASRRPGVVKYSYLMTGCHQTCENRYGTYSDIRKKSGVCLLKSSAGPQESFMSRSRIKVAICRSTLYWMPGTDQCWSVPMKLRLKVDRRLYFVKFCHALPLIDQQGCFYPY